MNAPVILEGDLTEFRTEKKPTECSRAMKGKDQTLLSSRGWFFSYLDS